MTTASDLRTKWMSYQVCKDVDDRVQAKWEADPENTELEAFAEKTYQGMWDAMERFAAALADFTGGQIDRKTARRMVMCPKYSDRLDDLMARLIA